MKKIGILIFVVAVVGGIVLARMFSFGNIPSVDLPEISFFESVKGSGNLKTEKRNARDFTSVDVGGVFAVEINAGEEYLVEVEADDNLLPLITTEVKNGTLTIESEKRFSASKRITIKISAPDIDGLDVSGASRAVLKNVSNEELAIDVSGASSVKVSGTTSNLVVDMGGASRLDASGLTAKTAAIDGGGASSAKVNVTDKLIADLGGASRVTYSGNPSEIRKSTSGGSRIRQEN